VFLRRAPVRLGLGSQLVRTRGQGFGFLAVPCERRRKPLSLTFLLDPPSAKAWHGDQRDQDKRRGSHYDDHESS
jgi:hypothetical protein